jgi:Putative zinc-finger
VSCPRTIELGAYVLGALDRQERGELEAHLDTCVICRTELERLIPLPGLLSRLSTREAERLVGAEAPPGSEAERLGPSEIAPGGEGAPGDETARRAPAPWAMSLDETARRERSRGAVLDGVLATVARSRRRSRRVRAVAVAAALVLAAFAGVGGELLRDGGVEQPAPLTASAVDPRTGVRGSAELSGEPWGTSVDLRLAGVRPGEHCRLVARAAGGRTEVAATWRAGYLGTAEVPGAVAIRPERLASLEVVTADDRVLVRMPVMPN